jgi:DNA-binding transcriptional MerR regulator
MRQTSKVEGTKIAQAAKDLNVTSVTIRRYLSEFNIETATDENGVKVLPHKAMEELKLVRKLKEDGLTNPKVLESLEAGRSDEAPAVAEKPSRQSAKTTTREEEKEEEELELEVKRPSRRYRPVQVEAEENLPHEAEANEQPPIEADQEHVDESNGEGGLDQRPKHSLTCQTCGKTFEHVNPRLRDCLDCYRTKRKERRRGGPERHKNVIQHPIAQQVANKAAQYSQAAPLSGNHHENGEALEQPLAPLATAIAPAAPAQPVTTSANSFVLKGQVRNYRKAIEETRQITGSLKRRLERPDLPEGDRRWLEQIYAYQLILHQGWRHLSDYKNNTQTSKLEE